MHRLHAGYLLTFRKRVSLRSDNGASAVEYGLVLGGVALIIVVSVFGFGGFVAELFMNSNACFNAGTSSTC